MCLTTKNGLKMIEFSSSLKLNEIQKVDSPFNKDPKNIFSREDLILGEGRSENLGNRDIYCYANRGWPISKENISPYPLVPKFL